MEAGNNDEAEVDNINIVVDAPDMKEAVEAAEAADDMLLIFAVFYLFDPSSSLVIAYPLTASRTL